MSRFSSRSLGRSQGFTLVELILTLILVGILGAVSTLFILQPFQASRDLERRAGLVDAADLALSRMVREVRGALPNSLRVHDTSGHVELVLTRTAGRYRRLPAPGGTGDRLVPALDSDSFDVLGGLLDNGSVVTRAAGQDCGTGTGDCLVIYNTGQDGFDVYRQQGVAAITAVSASSMSYDSDGVSPAFRAHSPRQRFYVISEVVSYVCEQGSLWRYSGYGLSNGAPDLTGEPRVRVAGSVDSCNFSYTPGSATRRGLLTLQLGLSDQGESVTLHAQAQVVNAP